jgi:uncharacterized protein (UPF0335 family)
MSDAGPGHNSATQFAREQLQALIERIERLEEEKRQTASDISDIYQEGKSAGFDTKALRTIVRLRKMDVDQRREQSAILDTYMLALGMAD